MKYFYSLVMGAKAPYVSGVFTSEDISFFKNMNIFYVKMGDIYIVNAEQAKIILSH